jgi:hypothetical protein
MSGITQVLANKYFVTATKTDEWDTAVDKAKQAIYELDRFLARNHKSLEDELDLNISSLKKGIGILLDTVKQIPTS